MPRPCQALPAAAVLIASSFAGAASGQITTTHNSGNVNVAIPDLGMVNVDVVVGNPPRLIIDVNAKVRISHTFDGDLELTLVHPGGTRVTLSNNNGSGNDDFGSGATDCTGDLTVFDDDATTSISAGTPPFVGTFFPNSPLQTLNAKGTKGTWHLEAADQSGTDVGTVHCVILEITSIDHPYDIDLNGVQDPLTDGLLILRFLFGFSGQTLTSGAVGANCLRCTPSEIQSFLTTLGFQGGT